jgi:hypothetical protein
MSLLLTWLWLLVIVAAAEVKVWPKPSHVVHGHESLWIDPELESVLFCGNGRHTRHVSLIPNQGSNPGNSFQSIIRHIGDWHASLWSVDNRSSFDADESLSEEAVLIGGVEKGLQSIKATRLVPWKLFPKRAAFEPQPTASSSVGRLEIRQAVCPADGFDSDRFFDADESYEMSIDEDLDGNLILIRSNSTLGTFRALGESY